MNRQETQHLNIENQISSISDKKKKLFTYVSDTPVVFQEWVYKQISLCPQDML